MKKHDCIEYLDRYSEEKGFDKVYDIFESLFPMDVEDCERAFWAKAPVTTLRKLVRVLKYRSDEMVDLSYASEKDMPDNIEELEIDVDESWDEEDKLGEDEGFDL
jgi:hypothetical protein